MDTVGNENRSQVKNRRWPTIPTVVHSTHMKGAVADMENEKNSAHNPWITILSSNSMRPLSTPLMIYCKAYLAVMIGSNPANEVIRYSFGFSARMDEGEAHTDLEQDLGSFFYPILGILRGLLNIGFSEEEAEELVISMMDFAPSELRRRAPIF